MGLLFGTDTFAKARESATQRRLWELSAAGRQRGPLEMWHNVGAAGEPAFANGWSNHVNGAPLSFRKHQSGFIYIRGRVQNTNVVDAAARTVCTLPPNYRPPFASAYRVGCDSRILATDLDAARTDYNVELAFLLGGQVIVQREEITDPYPADYRYVDIWTISFLSS
ncbi:MAG: hypothetical protein M3355_12145 [Actinomycetota bacterium]|nr:hypothetical protein [Actinomycetota bacterium]